MWFLSFVLILIAMVGLVYVVEGVKKIFTLDGSSWIRFLITLGVCSLIGMTTGLGLLIGLFVAGLDK